jgi:hypothetical protein
VELVVVPNITMRGQCHRGHPARHGGTYPHTYICMSTQTLGWTCGVARALSVASIGIREPESDPCSARVVV